MALIVLAMLIFLRSMYWGWNRITVKRIHHREHRKLGSDTSRVTVRTLVVLGSGGHTAEMISLLEKLDIEKYILYFVIAESDHTSMPKAISFLKQKGLSGASLESYFHISRIPRSREVSQSWASSLVSTFHAFLFSLGLIYRLRPQLILANGPGTCVPICFGALLLEVGAYVGIIVKLVFVESFCRTETLSFSGFLLYPFADRFVVMWSSLRNKLVKARYLGVLY